MPKASVEARMEAARKGLDLACQLLINPSPHRLEDCRLALGMAATSLAGCTAELARHAGDGTFLEHALRLRDAVHQVDYLLTNALNYHGKWLQILRSRMGGYTAQGDPAEIVCAGQVCLTG
jgi:hypothetical protein